MSINSILSIARDSLTAHQMAISIVGTNVANVNTPGYARQRTELVTNGTVNYNSNDVQIGVAVRQITRIYDRFIEARLIQQQQDSSYSDAMLQLQKNIEIVLDETNGGGINERLDRFWAAWEDLSATPSGKLERSALISTAGTLTGAIASYKQSLDAINTELNSSIADFVPLINDKISEIADINSQILQESSNLGGLNTLMDSRTNALRELGTMLNISYHEASDGTVNVMMANGEPLVQGAAIYTLSYVVTSGQIDIFNSNSPGNVNSSITGGKLGAYMEMQHSILPQYTTNLNDLTNALEARVNALHNGGFDADGNIGLDFFTITNALNPSGSIGLNPIIAADIDRIAASASVSGDGENAAGIATVRDELLMEGGTSTMSSFLASMVGEIGRQTANAQQNSDFNSAIMNYLTNQRESVSGVSVDEEMMLLMKYQLAYTAAGKLVNTVNDMTDTLMGIVR